MNVKPIVSPTRILVIDDELGMREGCRKILSAEGYEVETAEDGADGLELFNRRPGFAAVLADLKMPRMGGMELIEHIRHRDEDVVLLVITAYATIETAVEATKRGAYGYIPKPFTPDELLLPVRNGLERRSLAMKARRLQIAKSTFVSMVAHEVRSPLAAIDGYLSAILGKSALTEEDREMIERALLRARSLEGMLSELLNLNAIETGNFVLRRQPLDLRAVAEETVRFFADKAAAKRIELHLAPMPGGSVSTLADRDAMTSILSNLVDNAIKYTPEGGRVTVALERDATSVKLVVADTGIGMTAEEKDRAFEEFFRARNEHTARVPGAGLGLSLVQRLVEMHDGRIELASTLGQGSRFTVVVPFMT